MKTWTELLSQTWDGVEDEYGPHSHAVFGAIQVLAETTWFTRLGARPELSAEHVGTWEEALKPLSDDDRYGPSGHLWGPARLCAQVIDSDAYRAHWERARQDVYEYFGPSICLDPDWSEERESFVTEYIYDFVSFLLAEIIGSATIDSTYFREMLAFFHAGHLPCGWSGDWPLGCMRVY